MVQGAHYILGPFGQDSDLRRWGLKLAERGGRTPRNARWLRSRASWRVLLHKLWVSGEVYEPLRNHTPVEAGGVERNGNCERNRRVQVTAAKSWLNFPAQAGSQGRFTGSSTC